MDGGEGFQVTSLDAGVVSVMTKELPEPRVLPYPLKPIRNITGMAYNLYNNVWGTNYIYWYPYDGDTDYRARFKIIPVHMHKESENKLPVVRLIE